MATDGCPFSQLVRSEVRCDGDWVKPKMPRQYIIVPMEMVRHVLKSRKSKLAQAAFRRETLEGKAMGD